jgi:TPR repeat protein
MVDLIMPLAKNGDPEYSFSVGYTMMLCVEDKEAKKSCPYKSRDALPWIYRAAKQALPQAIETLQNGYEFGTFSLPKNPTLATCWGDVLEKKRDVNSCLKMEAEYRKRSG